MICRSSPCPSLIRSPTISSHCMQRMQTETAWDADGDSMGFLSLPGTLPAKTCVRHEILHVVATATVCQ